jgi:hypothetical protein
MGKETKISGGDAGSEYAEVTDNAALPPSKPVSDQVMLVNVLPLPGRVSDQVGVNDSKLCPP